MALYQRAFEALWRLTILLIIAGGASVWAQSDSSSVYMCPNGKTIMAADVRTPEDVRAFVHCAVDFGKANGLEAARTAFNQMGGQWRSPSIYIFASRRSDNGTAATMYIYPPLPDKVNSTLGEIDTLYGGEVFDEFYEIVTNFTKGFAYYKFARPQETMKRPKVSYAVRVNDKDVAGLTEDALFGAGVYPDGPRGACSIDSIGNLSKKLNSNPDQLTLQAYVRCVADKYALRRNWWSLQAALQARGFYNHNRANFFVLSTRQKYHTSWANNGDHRPDRSRPRYVANVDNGRSWHPFRWLDDPALKTKTDGQLTERAYQIIKVADAMGERFVYYKARDAQNRLRKKVAYLKRITSHGGEALIVGSDYFIPNDAQLPMGSCEAPKRYLTASQVETREDLEAFVRQARCYVKTNGIAAARTAFATSDWFDRDRNVYVYVEGMGRTAAESMVHVFPPDTTKEGDDWGDPFIDKYRNSYYPEVHRILSQFGSGYTYYSSTSGRRHREHYKTGYIMALRVDGQDLTIGSGLYEADTPIACGATLDLQRVQASQLDQLAKRNNRAAASQQNTLNALKSFVRCAAYSVEHRLHSSLPLEFLGRTDGADFDALSEAEQRRWTSTVNNRKLRAIQAGVDNLEANIRQLNRSRAYRQGDIYIFGYEHDTGDSGHPEVDVDSAGYTAITKNSLSEWGEIRRGEQATGPRRTRGQSRQNMLQITNDLGEAFVYYTTRSNRKKISFLKRVYHNNFPLSDVEGGAYDTPPLRASYYVGAGVLLPQ